VGVRRGCVTIKYDLPVEECLLVDLELHVQVRHCTSQGGEGLLLADTASRGDFHEACLCGAIRLPGTFKI
jgi:hypothetical protein